MKAPNEIYPPRWATRFLSWYCRPELLEDLQGDLNEYFVRNVKMRGPTKARLIYILDVFKFFRSYTLKKPQFLNLITQWIMIGSYIKTSGRSIFRNKLFSSINIVGLAVSMSVGLLMISFVSDLVSYDQFQEKKDRLYRVITTRQYGEESPRDLASTSVKTGRKIRETMSGVEDLTILRREFEGDAVVGESVIPIKALWADQSFFKVFTFPLLQGDPATALKEPYSLLLTEKSAKKLFGDANALGKSVRFDTLNYVVTGIMKEVPKLSHLRFDALVSFSTVEIQKPSFDGEFDGWASIYSNYVYLILPEKADPQTLQASLDKLCAQENVALNNQKITLSLQPLSEIVLGKNMSNPIGPIMPAVVVWILAGLALVVILSACFNYTNLSIARSLRRSREVGIRKVIGARKSHVVGQFIAESVIISLLALVFSFLLFLFLKTQFLGFDPFLEDLLSLELSFKVILYFIGMAVGVGVVAGFLPALFFSKINVIQVLRDVSSVKVFRHVTMRKALIVVQYTFSLIFITSTLIGFNQYKNFLTFDLGFSTENILNIKMQGNKGELLIKELAELSAVNGISRSRIVTSVGSMYGSQMKYQDPHDSAGVYLNFVDENYLPLHGHQLIAGRNFRALSKGALESEVIVNEQVLKRFNISGTDPQKALGEIINIDDKKLAIVGVLRDFHYGSVSDKIEPMLIRFSSDEPGGFLNVKIISQELPVAMAGVEKAWRKIDKVHPMEATFYTDQIERNYSQFSVMVKVIGFLSFLTICISSLGLFGMVVFTTETKLKEISIRKVMGASETNLIVLLSRGFLILLSLSALIAIPLTYFFFDQVVLTNFPYHQPIGLSELLTGAFGVMIIAMFMIGSQTLKVARSNPATVLKNE